MCWLYKLTPKALPSHSQGVNGTGGSYDVTRDAGPIDLMLGPIAVPERKVTNAEAVVCPL